MDSWEPSPEFKRKHGDPSILENGYKVQILSWHGPMPDSARYAAYEDFVRTASAADWQRAVDEAREILANPKCVKMLSPSPQGDSYFDLSLAGPENLPRFTALGDRRQALDALWQWQERLAVLKRRDFPRALTDVERLELEDRRQVERKRQEKLKRRKQREVCCAPQ